MTRHSAATHPTAPVGGAAARFANLSVPMPAAQVWDPSIDWSVFAVGVGTRVEVALAAVLKELGEGTAADLVTYWSRTRRAVAGGSELPVRSRRLLLTARQDTGRAKIDLDATLADLDGSAVLSAVAHTLLGPSSPTRSEVAAVCGPHPRAFRLGDSTSSVSIALRSPGWPASLGGAPLPNEVLRWVCLEARYAPWRDRRVRRLSRVAVYAEEQWPNAPARQAVPSYVSVDVPSS